MRFWVPTLIAIAVVPTGAHHPFTRYYDASKPGSVTGVVAELRVVNPHVVLIVEGAGPDGRSGRWAFEGYPPNVFARGLGLQDFRQRLQPGTRITISGWPANDPGAQAFSGRTVTFADGSTLLFGSIADGGDRWSCASGPCPYAYPDLR